MKDEEYRALLEATINNLVEIAREARRRFDLDALTTTEGNLARGRVACKSILKAITPS